MPACLHDYVGLWNKAFRLRLLPPSQLQSKHIVERLVTQDSTLRTASHISSASVMTQPLVGFDELDIYLA